MKTIEKNNASSTSLYGDLLSDIRETRNALNDAYTNFENVTDPDLVDCYIYELNSIQYRYKYLLRQAKQFQLTSMF